MICQFQSIGNADQDDIWLFKLEHHDYLVLYAVDRESDKIAQEPQIYCIQSDACNYIKY